jgi:hypothetical protein
VCVCVCVCVQREGLVYPQHIKEIFVQERERERGFECREVDRVNIFALAKQKKNSANANRN